MDKGGGARYGRANSTEENGSEKAAVLSIGGGRFPRRARRKVYRDNRTLRSGAGAQTGRRRRRTGAGLDRKGGAAFRDGETAAASSRCVGGRRKRQAGAGRVGSGATEE